MAKLTGIHLQAQHVKQITIASRTLAHARRIWRRSWVACAVPWDELDAALAAADIVVTATGAAEPVLTRARIEDVMRPRRNRPLFIIDIAVPRDVEPAAGDLDQVFLYNIDDLQDDRAGEPRAPRGRAARAEAIVDEEVAQVHGVDAVARDRADRRRAAAALRGDPAAPSSSGSSPSWPGCRPKRARASTKSRA